MTNNETTYGHDEKGNRVDVHRPSAIDPAHYEYVGGPEGVKYYWNGGSNCDHCGKFIRWAVRFNHLPSGERVEFGEICAGIIGVATDRSTYELNQLRKTVANQRKKIAAQKQQSERHDKFVAECGDVVRFLESLDQDGEKFSFLVDMIRSYDQWGSLTDRQTEAVRKVMKARADYQARKAAEPQPTTPLAEGKVTVEGEIVSTKWQDSDYGMTLKMLVVLSDLNRVWGTVPKSIQAEVEGRTDDTRGEYKGTGVSFTATFKRSDKDQHFGFFSRPTQAKVI